MCGTGHILSKVTLLPYNGLHAIILPTHIARIIVRLASAISNIDVMGFQEFEQAFR
jgi:hypothetical protein